ncbi:MAG: amidohydrolase family protein [Albidovulum sp.]|nr:amidohydrolase family protein [Albidovulum sp.]
MWKSAERLPAGSCDCHIHMLADDAEFPLWEGRVEDPPAGKLDDWIARFRSHSESFGLDRTVVVHSILYGSDNSVTLEAVRRLGYSAARGIALVGDSVTDAELDKSAESGIVGVRLNYVHGGILSWEGARAMAPRLLERGMHVQILMNARLHIESLADDVRRMPVPVVFDHIGWPDLSAGRGETGFQLLRSLIAEGSAWVKLSAAYRMCQAPYDLAADAIEALVEANPERCLWGSDWPYIMLGNAAAPETGDLLSAFLEIVGKRSTLERIFVENPEKLYGFDPL